MHIPSPYTIVISEGQEYRDIQREAIMIIVVTQFWSVTYVVCFIAWLGHTVQNRSSYWAIRNNPR